MAPIAHSLIAYLSLVSFPNQSPAEIVRWIKHVHRLAAPFFTIDFVTTINKVAEGSGSTLLIPIRSGRVILKLVKCSAKVEPTIPTRIVITLVIARNVIAITRTIGTFGSAVTSIVLVAYILKTVNEFIAIALMGSHRIGSIQKIRLAFRVPEPICTQVAPAFVLTPEAIEITVIHTRRNKPTLREIGNSSEVKVVFAFI